MNWALCKDFSWAFIAICVFIATIYILMDSKNEQE
jgi:hypothetical protein